MCVSFPGNDDGKKDTSQPGDELVTRGKLLEGSGEWIGSEIDDVPSRRHPEHAAT